MSKGLDVATLTMLCRSLLLVKWMLSGWAVWLQKGRQKIYKWMKYLYYCKHHNCEKRAINIKGRGYFKGFFFPTSQDLCVSLRDTTLCWSPSLEKWPISAATPSSRLRKQVWSTFPMTQSGWRTLMKQGIVTWSFILTFWRRLSSLQLCVSALSAFPEQEDHCI